MSVSVRLPERLPLAVGVNVTLITQLPLAASGVLVLQVVPLAATAKSPVAAMLVKVKDAVPLLVTVTALGALVIPRTVAGNDTLLGDNIASGPVPVPVNEMTLGLSPALSVTITSPLRTPASVGVNTMAMVQLALTATPAPQLSVSLKSPLAAILAMANATSPLFVKVTVSAELGVLSCWLPNERLPVDRITKAGSWICRTRLFQISPM